MGTVYWPEKICKFLLFFCKFILTNQVIRIRFRLADLLRHRGQVVLDLVKVFNRDVFDGQLLFT